MPADDTQDAQRPARRILVVDDEVSFVKIVKRWLRETSYEVETATTGRGALDRIAAERFDAIVADVHIGDDDGVDLLRQVRKHDPDVPVIMMSGAPALSSAIPSIELRAFKYLVKPFGHHELSGALEEAVAAHDAAVASRAASAHVEKEASERRTLAASLDRALRSLYLARQPIVRFTSRTTFAYEALLRTEDRVLSHPGAVLAAAEDLGRLHTLGRMLRERASKEMPPEEGALLFVNLHAADLLDEELYAGAAPLSAHARRIVLEITERAALPHALEIRPKIDELRRLGYRIAIDDLGAGYAGLTSVATLEPEVMKLDMSIIRGVERSRPHQRLIKSMVAVARDAGAELIAEGVETHAEREALVDLGIDLFQGYLFARPAPGFPPVVWGALGG